MSITLTYSGDPKYTEIRNATSLAQSYLQGSEIVRVVQERTRPFDDSNPSNLNPDEVATYINEENFTLLVMDYSDREGRTTVGGMFDPSKPNQININVLALPHRETCEFVGVIVHEAIHALSRRIERKTNGRVSFYARSRKSEKWERRYSTLLDTNTGRK